MVKVIVDGKEHLYDEGIKYEIVAKEYQKAYKNTIALVVVNGKIRELMKRLEKDCTIEFITTESAIGHKTYVRTAVMLLMKAIQDVMGQGSTNHVKVEFTIGAGYYCSVNHGFHMTDE